MIKNKNIKMSATECIKFISNKFNIYSEVVDLYRQHTRKLAQTIKPKRNADIKNLFRLNYITNIDSLEAFTDQIHEHIGEGTFNTYLERFNDNMVFPISQILTKYNCTWTDIEQAYYIWTIYNAYVGYKAQDMVFNAISEADNSLKIVQSDSLDKHGIDYLLVSDNLKIALQVKSIKTVLTSPKGKEWIKISYKKAQQELNHRYKGYSYYFMFYIQDKQDNYHIVQEQIKDTHKMLFTYEELAHFKKNSYSYNNMTTSNGSLTLTDSEHLTNYIGSLFMVNNMTDNNTNRKDNNNNDK